LRVFLSSVFQLFFTKNSSLIVAPSQIGETLQKKQEKKMLLWKLLITCHQHRFEKTPDKLYGASSPVIPNQDDAEQKGAKGMCQGCC